jgi:hypothetical protein
MTGEEGGRDYGQGVFEGKVLTMFEFIRAELKQMSQTKDKEHGEIRAEIAKHRIEVTKELDSVKADIRVLNEWRWRWVAIGLLVAFFGGIIGSIASAVISSQINKAVAAETAFIKGNGESMAYHLPSCPSYELTKVGNHRDDAIFYSEQDARDHGFTLASNCE